MYTFKSHTDEFNGVQYTGDDCFCTAVPLMMGQWGSKHVGVYYIIMHGMKNVKLKIPVLYLTKMGQEIWKVWEEIH